MNEQRRLDNRAGRKAEGGRDGDAARRSALVQAAAALHKQGEHDAALERWLEIRREYPRFRPALVGALRSAQAAGRFGEAEALLREGTERFPAAAARLQKVAGAGSADLDDEPEWQKRVAQPPGDGKGELKAALAPLSAKKARKGRDGQRRMAAVLSRVELVLTRYPALLKARLEHLDLLSALGRHEEAAKAAATYRTAFPDDEKIALAQVNALEHANALEAALEACGMPDPAGAPKLTAARIRILSRLQQSEAAEAETRAALAAKPGDLGLMAENAMLAVRRGDWTEALSRWLVAEAAHPEAAKVKKGLSTVRLQLAQFEPPAPAAAQSETARLLGRFESLGGTSGGCEFGMVQRQFGANGLGMLRWSNIPIVSLMRGLERGFDGVGLPENTGLRTARLSPTREEYMIRDNAYGFGAHTFIETKDVPEDKMLAQTAKRLAFLRSKLVEEIAAGKKIFVFKLADTASDDIMAQLGDVFGRAGPGQMVCAVKADARHPKGTLRRVSGNVLAAYLGHFMSDAAGENRGIDFATWHDICARALELCHPPEAAASPSTPQGA